MSSEKICGVKIFDQSFFREHQTKFTQTLPKNHEPKLLNPCYQCAKRERAVKVSKTHEGLCKSCILKLG